MKQIYRSYSNDEIIIKDIESIEKEKEKEKEKDK